MFLQNKDLKNITKIEKTRLLTDRDGNKDLKNGLGLARVYASADSSPRTSHEIGQP